MAETAFLATIWFLGSAVLVILVIVQTLLDHYGNRTSDAWGWLLPTFMPTLSLITGVMVVDPKRQQSRPVDPFVFVLASVVSTVYLFIVLLTILLAPFSALGEIQLMRLSNLWLGPTQGLVTALTGVFFVQSKGEGQDEEAEPGRGFAVEPKPQGQ
jgi:hypothetical protein